MSSDYSSSNSGENNVEVLDTKIYYTYEEIHKSIEDKTESLQSKKFDYILAIGGGGLMPARMIRRVINVPILVISIKFYSGDKINSEPQIVQWDSDISTKLKGKSCLIVDEIYDTGSTLKYVIDRLNKDGVNDLSALVIHHKNKEEHRSDFFEHIMSKLQNYFPLITVGDRWIVYPWEASSIEDHNKKAERCLEFKKK